MIIAINIKYTKYISRKVRFQNKWRAMATLHEKNDSCCIKSQIISNYFLDEFSESNFFMMHHAINSISSYLLKLL